MDTFMQAAIEQAILGQVEGGIPIGSVLVYRHEIIGRGRNRRIQRKSAILHGEMATRHVGEKPQRDALSGKCRREFDPVEFRHPSLNRQASPAHKALLSLLPFTIYDFRFTIFSSHFTTLSPPKSQVMPT